MHFPLLPAETNEMIQVHKLHLLYEPVYVITCVGNLTEEKFYVITCYISHRHMNTEVCWKWNVITYNEDLAVYVTN
jgi:hypothetical protein